MLLDRVSNPGPLTYESDALPVVPRGRHPLRVAPARGQNLIGVEKESLPVLMAGWI